MAVNTSVVRPEAGSDEDRARRLALARWQLRLLPFMGGVLGLLTAFFFSATVYQLYQIQTRIEHAPALDVAGIGGPIDVTGSSALALVRWRTLATLEGHALQRRYHQANVLLMARLWIQYLGFVTGMTLALVGATFILGKLRESTSRVDAEAAGGKLSVQSASPGIILALLGTVLMLSTMLTHNDIDVHDGPLYVSIDRPAAAPADESGSAPAPWRPTDPGPELMERLKGGAPTPHAKDAQ